MNTMEEPIPPTLRSRPDDFDARPALSDLYALENWAMVRNLIETGPASTNGKTSHIETVSI